ncbi:MAG: pseudouridine-5'-phosphate glycosidase [Eubacteriales bacterium]|nr:pseudouridine-5'-phosphate glycosidase [Eubacteriales bacterium]
MSEFIIESALLTHGLKSITNEQLKKIWDRSWTIAWLEEGRIIVGEMERFCEFRKRAAGYKRINYFNFDKLIDQGESGALTASGTMRVCEEKGIPLVVTCGIGGLVRGQEVRQCNDLWALSQSSVSMVATTFKDMFDFYYTVQCAKMAGISVCASLENIRSGYLFDRADREDNEIEMSESKLCVYDKFPVRMILTGRTLYLNPIPIEKRIGDQGILETAVAYGKEQERSGKYFHPCVNAKIDELTKGRSSEIQLESLVENIRLAQKL